MTVAASRSSAARERLARGEVGRGAHVDGRHGEAGGLDLAAAAGDVQLVDRSRAAAERLRRAPDDPARGVAQADVSRKDGREREIVDDLIAEASLVQDCEAGVADGRDAAETRVQVFHGSNAHAPMLAKGRREREGEEWRDQQAEAAGEQVPVARRTWVGKAAAEQPGVHQRTAVSAGDVEDRRQPDHADGERTHARTIAERERAAGRAGGGKLDTDDEGGRGDDERRPGQVGEERSVQRRASWSLRRVASAASRRVMRRYSK